MAEKTLKTLLRVVTKYVEALVMRSLWYISSDVSKINTSAPVADRCFTSQSSNSVEA